MSMPQSHQVVVTAPQTINFTAPRIIYDRFRSKQAFGLGVTMIIAGVLNIILTSIGIHLQLHFAGAGIVHGILLIITGSFGIVASKYKTRGWIITLMVMAIITACLAGISLYVDIMGLIFGSSAPCYYYYRTCSLTATYAFGSLIFIADFVGGVTCIWSSALCCKVVCCCSTAPQMMMAAQFVPMQTYMQPAMIRNDNATSEGQIIIYPTGVIMGNQAAVNQPYMPSAFEASGGRELTAPPSYNYSMMEKSGLLADRDD